MFIQQQIDHLIQVNAGGDGWDAGRWEIQLKHYQKCNAIITCKFKQYYAKTFLATYRIQGTIWGCFLNDQQQKFILFRNGFSWRSLKSFGPWFYGHSCQKFVGHRIQARSFGLVLVRVRVRKLRNSCDRV